MSKIIKHIVCTIEGNYAPHFATMCCSLFENNKNSLFKIYLIYDSLKLEDKEKLIFLFRSYNQNINFIRIKAEQFHEFPLSAHASYANYFRIELPNLLPADLNTVLYLDCDVIIDGEIENIWRIDLRNKALAAWGYENEEKSKKLTLENRLYFNSGVMVLNLDYWRENKISKKVINFIQRNSELIDFWDQDALNAVLKNEWIPLNEEYNYTKSISLNEINTKPKIVHFVGMHKPWNPHCNHPLKWKYFHYLNKTLFDEKANTRIVKYAFEKLQALSITVKKSLNLIEKNKYVKEVKPEYFEKRILTAQEGNDLLGRKIANKEVFFVGRIGSTELSCLCYFNNIYKFSRESYLQMKHNMNIASGFFPSKRKYLKKFAETYVHDALEQADLMGVWFNRGEEQLLEKYNKNITCCELKGLEPYYHNNPWTKNLKGKTVLIIHPFADSIKRQYKIREHLFSEKEMLPDFELKIIQTVQSIAGNKVSYRHWFEALDYMKNQINNELFDIAIIGAGAYGFHLGGYVKSLGKTAIHLGGATQILFGIKGKRWDDNPAVSSLYNSYWTYPNGNERPKNADNVENGCYW